jgi:bifunctional DNA-binding transcriptional regulator/antitoxin component of YhaV-PrlF toxin-antitoxin module
MVDNGTATLQMDRKGRITIPKSTRRALNVDGESADVRVSVEVLERHGENE